MSLSSAPPPHVSTVLRIVDRAFYDRSPEPDVDAQLDAYVRGGARLLGAIVALTLLVVQVPTAIALGDGSSQRQVLAILGSAMCAAIAVLVSWVRAVRGEFLSVVVTLVAAGALFLSAAMPLRPNAVVDPAILVAFVPCVFLSVVAYAPVRVSVALVVVATLCAIHVVLWRVGALRGNAAFHGLLLAFLGQTGMGAAWLCVVRRRGLRRLYAREAELSRANERLTELLRAVQAQHDQLLASERMAVLGRLAGGLAHEINNPLSATRNALAELEQLHQELAASLEHPDVSSADLHAILEDVRGATDLAAAAADRAARYLRGLKLQTRTLGSPEERPFDLVAEANAVIALLRHRSEQCGVAIELDAPANVPLNGDPGAIAQVLTNLLDNALHACAKWGEPRAVPPVRVIVRREGDEIALLVVDRGPGIDPSIADRVFEPLVTTKPFGVGTGLGLSICSELVVGLGGQIRAYETEGGGATFEVRLPLGTSQAGYHAA